LLKYSDRFCKHIIFKSPSCSMSNCLYRSHLKLRYFGHTVFVKFKVGTCLCFLYEFPYWVPGIHSTISIKAPIRTDTKIDYLRICYCSW
jgi:hypothetical protein